MDVGVEDRDDGGGGRGGPDQVRAVEEGEELGIGVDPAAVGTVAVAETGPFVGVSADEEGDRDEGAGAQLEGGIRLDEVAVDDGRER